VKGRFAVTAAIVLLCLGSLAQADVFDLGPGFTNLETVIVGDPGNVGQLSGAGSGGYGPDRIVGSVGYTYNIGKYEVTAKQYTDFLNAKAKTDPYGLYNTNMWSNAFSCKIERSGGGTVENPYTYTVTADRANRPVNWVDYNDAVRFANWLHNGQGDGDTETGAYTWTTGGFVTRNPGWKWAVTSEDEWYKAAYYKGGGTNAGYWRYPTGSDTAPGRDLTDTFGNSANYYSDSYLIGSPYYRTEVGEFQNSESPYGTFDQGGNVWEWNEQIIVDTMRGLRGGAFFGDGLFELEASTRMDVYPASGGMGYGFRLVQAVPEPSSLIVLAAGLGMLLSQWRRRA